MPPDLTDQIRAWITSVAREAVQTALAEASIAHAEYLSTEEAAVLASVTPGTVRRWIDQGRVQRHGAGREIRVRRDELEVLMRRGAKRQPPRARTLGEKKMSPEEQALHDLGL